MKKGYHDYKPSLEVEKKEPKKYIARSTSLVILNKIPEHPIGYLKNMEHIIQTTNEKGNINVDSFVLMFGSQAPKPGPGKMFINSTTAHASKILDR